MSTQPQIYKYCYHIEYISYYYCINALLKWICVEYILSHYAAQIISLGLKLLLVLYAHIIAILLFIQVANPR